MIPAPGPVPSASVAPDPDASGADLLTRKEASVVLAQFGIRLKPETLARIWSTGGDGPPCRHIRSKPYYPRGVLEAWARSQVGDLRSGAPSAAQARRHG